MARGRQVESREQRLRIAAFGRGTHRLGFGWQAQNLFLDEIDEAFERREADRFGAVVGVRDEGVNIGFIVREKRVDVRLV